MARGALQKQMNLLLQILGWLVGAIIYVCFCRWVYLLGYGRTPKDVCEPVRILSTGETRPPERPRLNYGTHVIGTTAHMNAFNSAFEIIYGVEVKNPDLRPGGITYL